MKRFGHLVFAARSEIGLKRKNNEDAYGAFPSHGIWCVADGMGGGDDGEIASAAVIQSVEGFCRDCPMPAEGAFSAWDVSRGVAAAVNSASSWIFRRTQAKRLKGCGSTFAGVVFDATRPSGALAMHAGDSRVYRIRGKEIRQITKDHSAAELVGVKKESDLNPMFRGMILRAVGIAETVEVDVTPVDVCEGDFLLVCSDGLSRMIPDRKTLSIVRENSHDVNLAAGKLIEAVYSAGAADNVTAVLISVRELPGAAAEVLSPFSADIRETGGWSDDPATRDTSAESDTTSPDDSDTGLTRTVSPSPDAGFRGNQDAGQSDLRAAAGKGPYGLLRMCRKNPFTALSTAVLVLLALVSFALAAVLAYRRDAAVPAAGHSVTGGVSRIEPVLQTLPASGLDASSSGRNADVAETGMRHSPAPPDPGRGESVGPGKGTVPPDLKRTEESVEERERRKLADILKAERAKMLEAEAAEAAVAARCHEAAVVLGEVCRNRAVFPVFLSRMTSVAGSAACASIRMCGQTIASMKPDENGFAAAACDFVREMQKFHLLLKEKRTSGKIPRRKFARLSAMDPTSREAYELAVEIVVSVSKSGGRK